MGGRPGPAGDGAADESRRELIQRLRREDRITEEEFALLSGPSLGWSTALYYMGGGLLLLGVLALAASFWGLGGRWAHILISLAIWVLLGLGALLLRRRGHPVPGVLLLLGAILAAQLVAISLAQVAGPALIGSWMSLTPLGTFLVSLFVLASTALSLALWRAPVVTGALVVALLYCVQSAAALACGTDSVCAGIPASVLGTGLALLAAGLLRDLGRLGRGAVSRQDHAFWLSMLGLAAADLGLPQLFAWDTAVGALFLLLQAMALAAAVRTGRRLLAVFAAIAVVIYVEAQVLRVFSSVPLLGPLSAVGLGAAALALGIALRRRAAGALQDRGSIWL